MLHLPGSLNPFADSFSRREAMRVGGLGTLSVALPELFPLQSLQADSSPSSATFGRAKRILLIYLQGAAASSNLSDRTERISLRRLEFCRSFGRVFRGLSIENDELTLSNPRIPASSAPLRETLFCLSGFLRAFLVRISVG
ncbi:MAG: hypothetical protein IID45_15655 [Planctomycetes bacterium]|nr:hypothetical protein [Planctomycetota bacterium]